MKPINATLQTSNANLVIRVFRAVSIGLVWLTLALVTFWAVAALYFDVRVQALRAPLAVLYAASAIAVVLKGRPRTAWAIQAAGFVLVLAWWLSLRPTNEGPWKPNNERTAWAESAGDAVTIHNLRNCHYRSEEDYTDCWTDKTVRLSNLQGADFFLTTWGPKYIAHPIVSFDFGSDGHVAFSIEVRYRPGQEYSPVLGFFRQFGLIMVAADERDVIRLRTNYRQGENVYVYRTTVRRDTAAAIFETYIRYLNQLREQPEWYNAVTKNCTTTLNRQIDADLPDPKPWDYRLLFNGTIDELLYQRGRLVTAGLRFEALKEQAHINPAARAADADPDFSSRIRDGRPGF